MGLLTRMWKRTLENPSTPLSAPDDWLFDSLGSFRASSGVNVNRETALTYDAYWRCCNLLSGDVAKLPLNVLKVNQEDNTKTHDRDHPAYALLRYKACAEIMSLQFKRALTMHAVSEGNGYAYIMRNGAGEPLELWPLNPMKTYPVRVESGKGDVALWYVTEVGSNTTKQTRKFRAEDVFHLKGLSFDGLVGYSAVAKMRESLGLALAYESFGSIHFRNNARPGIVLKHPGRLKPEAKQNLRESWERMHSGLENAHRTAILEDGMDMVPIETNLRNSQLLEGKAFSRVQIANFFGVPQHKVGSTANVSYNSLEQENDSYVTDGHGLGYWLSAWEAEAWDKLLSEAEKAALTHAVEFARAELTRGNLATRTTYYIGMLDRGVLNPDEVRAEEGLNPRPDGEGGKYMTSVQVQAPGDATPPEEGKGKDAPASKPPPKSKPDDGRARLLLADVFGRMLRRLGVRIRRAANRPGEFLSLLEAALADQRDGLTDTLAPPLYAIGSGTPAAVAVDGLLADFHRDALTAAEVPAKDLAGAIDALCRRWETEGPPRLAEEVLSRPFERYDPNQPREPDGKFGEGGGDKDKEGEKPKEGPQQPFDKTKDANKWAADNMKINGEPSKEEKDAVQHYRREGYKDINTVLRSGPEGIPSGKVAKAETAIKHLDAVIDRSTIGKDVVAIRGMRSVLPADIKEGQHFGDRGFTSTTIDRVVAKGFVGTKDASGYLKLDSKDAVVHINIPAGSRGIYLKERHESEVLLPRGSVFRVDKVHDGPNGSKVIHASVVSQNDPGLMGRGIVWIAETRTAGPGLDRFVWSDGDLEALERGARDFNPDQPRDPDGKFGSGGGTAGSDKLHEAAGEKAKTLIGKIKDLPARIATAARDKVASVYGKLEARYGKATAVAIVGAGLLGVPLPVPGASFVTAAPVLAAAELYHRFAGKRSDDKEKKYTDDELKALGKEWLEELVDDWKKNDLPKLDKGE